MTASILRKANESDWRPTWRIGILYYYFKKKDTVPGNSVPVVNPPRQSSIDRCLLICILQSSNRQANAEIEEVVRLVIAA